MKPPAELLYNLAALTLVAAFAYFFFWEFVVLAGFSLLVSLGMMALEYVVR